MLATTTRSPLSMEAWEIIANAPGIPDTHDDMRPVWRQVHQVATSAVANNWTETEFRNSVQDGVKTAEGKPANRLWRMLTHRRGRKQKWATVDRLLSSAWNAAVENIANGFNPQREADILATAEQWSHAIANPCFALSNSEADVLGFAIHEVTRRKFRKVTLPGRYVAEHTGLSHKGAVDALRSLTARGILVQHSRGTWVGLGNRGRAAIYSLANPADFASLLGTLTLHQETTSDQHLSHHQRPSGTHTSPLLGEVCIEKSPYYSRDLGREGPSKGQHPGSDGVGGAR